jgi:hypothetical protein
VWSAAIDIYDSVINSRLDHRDQYFTIDNGVCLMEQNALKNVDNCLNTNIYSYLETSGGQSSNLYLNVVYFFNARIN